MPGGVRVTKQVHFARRSKGRREISPGPAPVPQRTPHGRVPRVSRLMALAIRLDGYLREGVVADQADLARLGHVSRARITQIMNLLHLAPDIQEALLFLPRVAEGRDPITERDLRPIAACVDWRKQRRAWAELTGLRAGGGTQRDA